MPEIIKAKPIVEENIIPRPKITEEAAAIAFTEQQLQAQQVLLSREEEKITPESAEPQTIERQATEPAVIIPTVKPEPASELQPMVQTGWEVNQPVFEEQASDIAAIIDLPEIPQPEQQLFVEADITKDEQVPEVVYDFVQEVPELDLAAAVPDTEQADESVMSAEFPIEFMTDEISIYRPEIIMQRMDETVAGHFEQLEPEARESALIILEDITTAIREISETPHELEPEKLAEIEQNLTELCTEFFEHIGLTPDEETIKWFVQNLMIGSTSIDQQPLNSSAFMEEGTHEQLQANFHMLSKLLQLIKRTSARLRLLGQLAVQVIPLPNPAVS